MERQTYPSDVSDDEWSFVAPYLTLMTQDAPQREHDLREVFNGLRPIVRAGAQWRMMPHDLPPWAAVYQQTQRWLKDATKSPRLPSLTVERGNRVQKVGIALAMMEP